MAFARQPQRIVAAARYGLCAHTINGRRTDNGVDPTSIRGQSCRRCGHRLHGCDAARSASCPIADGKDANELDARSYRPLYLGFCGGRTNRIMAKQCEICGKAPVVGRKVSHAHNVSARRFEPNLQRVRAMINGGVRRIRVCTRCLRSNKVVKAA
jgi:large subunit ribosomal protein L28